MNLWVPMNERYFLKELQPKSNEKWSGSKGHSKQFFEELEPFGEVNLDEVVLGEKTSWEDPPADGASRTASQSWTDGWKTNDGVDPREQQRYDRKRNVAQKEEEHPKNDAENMRHFKKLGHLWLSLLEWLLNGSVFKL